MRHRFSPFPLILTVLALSLGFAGHAAAAAPPTTGGGTPPVVTPASPGVTIDPVLAKLNALEDQLDAMTTKLDAMTLKLNTTTAKLDALTAKTQNIWETTHYTKGYLQGGIPAIFDMVDKTCNVARDARDLAHVAAYGGPSQVFEVFKCP